MAKTSAAYAEYEELSKIEIIDGITFMMAPSGSVGHGTSGTNLARILGNYLLGKRCRVFSDGVDVHLDEKTTLVPDVFIVCDKGKIHHDGIYGAPDFVAEVLSPSTMRRDRGVKKDAYERAGVREYWLINPIDKSIEVHILRDGKFYLDNVYVIYEDWEWKKLTPAEKEEATLKLKVSLYDDLIVDIREVFENV